ncbi:MAG: nitroreductase family deazaflavin-dependent oxidoreductase [Acidimicrobiales bacterium]
MAERYLVPGWFTRNVFNRGVSGLTKLGVSVWGSRVLAVRGRKSNEWRTTPVNLLEEGGERYLVSPRGTTQWVRNIRAAGEGELRIGRRVEPITVIELSDDDKIPVLRAYLKRWKMEVGVFFEGTGANATDEQLRAIGPKHPVFRLGR